MKKILNFSLLFLAILAFSSAAFAQKKIKQGMVKFEMEADAEANPEMAMLAGSTLNFYFSNEQQRMDMDMLGGMMKVQTIIPIKNPADGIILMDMLGQKIQLIGLKEEDMTKNYNFMNVDDMNDVKYDESDKKEIAGYPCYKATVTMDNGMTMKYYITEKIQPPAGIKKKDKKLALKGYPLQMIIDTGQGMEMVFKATEVSDELPEGVFSVPEGYQKMTMEEFQEMTGGMLGN
jgi:Domain of unknown function (DUF4412)